MSERLDGIVVRRIGQIFSVLDSAGISYCCQLPARLKKEQVDVRIGDEVRLAHADATNRLGTVAEVLPRKRTLMRPPIANVDQLLIVFAATQPDFSSLLLDRFLVLAAMTEVPATIVINKCDLVSPEALEAIVNPYREIGYPVVETSAREGQVGELVARLANRISVFAGPSGVGKSSLLNRIDPSLELRAAEVSEKLGRGRHTTTYAALYPAGGGLLADTPGYSHLDFPVLPPAELGWLYPEMAPHVSQCKLSDCLHDSEPGCAVKACARISARRFESYFCFLAELQDRKRQAQKSSQKRDSAVKTVGGGKRLVRISTEARADSRRLVRQRLAEFATQGPQTGAPDDRDDV